MFYGQTMTYSNLKMLWVQKNENNSYISGNSGTEPLRDYH